MRSSLVILFLNSGLDRSNDRAMLERPRLQMLSAILLAGCWLPCTLASSSCIPSSRQASTMIHNQRLQRHRRRRCGGLLHGLRLRGRLRTRFLRRVAVVCVSVPDFSLPGSETSPARPLLQRNAAIARASRPTSKTYSTHAAPYPRDEQARRHV